MQLAKFESELNLDNQSSNSSILNFLRQLWGQNIEITDIQRPKTANEMPLSNVKVCSLKNAPEGVKRVVIRKMNAGPFGMEELEDRARHVLFCGRTYDSMPQHPSIIDFGFVDQDGGMTSISGVQDFFILEEFIEGSIYGEDFSKLQGSRKVTESMLNSVDVLADYLAKLHSEPVESDVFRYRRALRDVVGSGEGVIGLIDGYPESFHTMFGEVLNELEVTCLKSMQRLRNRPHRLRRVHGDFHPWNIIFDQSNTLWTIDKSRADLNDPAIDVGSMLMNYLMLGLLQENYKVAFQLARRFLGTYLELTHDLEILQTLPLYTGMRAAAVASPIFYPDISKKNRLEAFKVGNLIANLESLDYDLETFDRAMEIIR